MPDFPTAYDFPPTMFYGDVRLSVRDGDIALFRNKGPIANTGSGDWTHCGLCHWNRDPNGRQISLYVVQFREWRGCVSVPLSREVRRQPGRIDLFRPTCSQTVAYTAQELLCRQQGISYGWWTIAQDFFMRLTLLRLLTGWTPDRNNPMLSAWLDEKDCSQGVVFALRTAAGEGSKWDIIPHKSDKSAVPSDLAFTGSTNQYAQGLVIEQGVAA